MFNPNTFNPDNMNMNNVTNPIQPRPKQKTMKKTHSIVVDSRNRNTTTFPDANNFEFRFNPSDTFSGAALYKNFKNIVEIKLVECILPTTFENDVATPYLILEIPELNDNMIGTSQQLSRAFTILLPDRIFGTSQQKFVHCRVNNMSYSFKKFDPPLNTLHKMTFKFNRPDGTLYDNASFEGTADANQIMLIFEITTLQIDRKMLNADIIRPTQ